MVKDCWKMQSEIWRKEDRKSRLWHREVACCYRNGSKTDHEGRQAYLALRVHLLRVKVAVTDDWIPGECGRAVPRKISCGVTVALLDSILNIKFTGSGLWLAEM